MHPSTRFLFAAAAYVLAADLAPAAEPFRLDRLPVVQYSPLANGRLREAQGVLHLEGPVVWGPLAEVDRPADLPDDVLHRPLVRREAWVNLYALAPGALANFTLDATVPLVTINGSELRPVSVAPNAQRSRGRMVNLSTRARITPGDAPVIAGFVVEGHPRTLLLRAVGPTLAGLGVPDAAPDPVLRLYRGTDVIFANDNWGTHWGAETTRATTARVGAFTLDEGSGDAAFVLTLEPGVYTAHVEPAATSATGGTILVEIYEVPLEP